ncbi:hypothetical protein OG568_40640 [Streptomyces sp. NBC_01450]|uniref:hypothetical protein n=1 Tax=Streptomyces sp. NBC_01450 TaxID=2903871 RepID=UPI002E308C76|nr:hypothetical protein [Streptomyces sp. NBC_01450]
MPVHRATWTASRSIRVVRGPRPALPEGRRHGVRRVDELRDGLRELLTGMLRD